MSPQIERIELNGPLAPIDDDAKEEMVSEELRGIMDIPNQLVDSFAALVKGAAGVRLGSMVAAWHRKIYDTLHHTDLLVCAIDRAEPHLLCYMEAALAASADSDTVTMLQLGSSLELVFRICIAARRWDAFASRLTKRHFETLFDRALRPESTEPCYSVWTRCVLRALTIVRHSESALFVQMCPAEMSGVLNCFVNVSRRMEPDAQAFLWREFECLPIVYFAFAPRTLALVGHVRQTICSLLMATEVWGETDVAPSAMDPMHQILKALSFLLDAAMCICDESEIERAAFVPIVAEVASALQSLFECRELNLTVETLLYTGAQLAICTRFVEKAGGVSLAKHRLAGVWHCFFARSFSTFMDASAEADRERFLAVIGSPAIAPYYFQMDRMSDDEFRRFAVYCSLCRIEDVSTLLCTYASRNCTSEAAARRVKELVLTRLSTVVPGSIGLQSFSTELLKALPPLDASAGEQSVPPAVANVLKGLRKKVVSASA